MNSSATELVLRTTAGDLLVRLRPDLAPVSVAQVSRLVDAGTYAGAALTYVDPGFVLQFSVDDAGLAAPKLAAERSPAMHHRRGTVSLTHADGDVDGGKATFFITLGDHPEMDGQYTVIGEVTDGFGTLAALEGTPTAKDGTPTDAVTLTKAQLLKTPAERFTLTLANGKPTPAAAPVQDASGTVMVASLGGVVLLAFLGVALRRRLGERALQSCLIGAVLVATPGILAYVTPRLAGHGVWAAVAVAGLLGLLRMLGKFETAA